MLDWTPRSASPVRDMRSRVTVDGVVRAVESWDLSREIVGDMPAQASTGTGVRAATGTIHWAPQAAVRDSPPHPWLRSGGWPPVKGQRVLIEVSSDGGATWLPRFVGLIDETVGEVWGHLSSTIVDGIDALASALPTVPAILWRHPVPGGGKAAVDASIFHVVAEAMRVGGFYVTPPMDDPVLRVPFQRSAFPAVGRVLACAGRTSEAPLFYAEPWGFAVADFTATYAATGVTTTSTWGMSLMLAEDHAGTGRITMGPSAVDIGADRSVTVASGPGLSAAQMAGAVTVTITASNGRVGLVTDTGQEASGPVPTAADLSRVQVAAALGARIAGLGIKVAPPHMTHASWRPNARIRQGAWGPLLCSPALVDRQALDVLKEISNSTLSAFWIDETGVAQWAPSDALNAQYQSVTWTTRDDITGLSWQSSLLGVRRSVDIAYQATALSDSSVDNIGLWEGQQEIVLTPGQQAEIFAEPQDQGTDWIEPSFVFRRLDNGGDGTPDPGNMGDFNLPIFSWIDGTYESAGVEYTAGPWITVKGTELAPNKALIQVKNVTGTRVIRLQTPNHDGLRKNNQGRNLPVLRGRGRVDRTEVTYQGSRVGPEWAPSLVHDMGRWGYNLTAATISAWAARQLADPQPTIERLTTVYDGRLQLGDTAVIHSDLLNVSFKVLLVGLRESSDFVQEWTVRIISDATRLRRTWGAVQQDHSGKTWAKIQAEKRGLSWAAVETGA